MNKTSKKNVEVRKIVVTTLCMLSLCFFMLSGCENKNDDECIACEECSLPFAGVMMADCYVSSFMEGVSKYLKCSDVYLIKGIALDEYEYGRNIKFVEDLKGNFPKDINTFIAWGGGNRFFLTEREDNLIMYDKEDVLIMQLSPAKTRQFDPELSPEIKWFEKTGDYCTLSCVSSVLKLSDDYVTGHIFPNEGKYDGKDSISFKDFQKKLQKIINIK